MLLYSIELKAEMLVTESRVFVTFKYGIQSVYTLYIEKQL